MRINRGTGYGLELPCKNTFKGDDGHITEQTFQLVKAGCIKYLKYNYENKADVVVNSYVINVAR